MDVEAAVKALGFSMREFERRSAGVGTQTLDRLKQRPSSVKPHTKAKIMAVLEVMKRERELAFQSLKKVLSA